MKNVKSTLLKFLPLVIIFILSGWGIASVATGDIKTANENFSALGMVSEISENGLSIKDAKGSDKSRKTSYNLNLDYLESIETSAYIPLNFSDIKIGDKIISQGLTNGNTYFIKRIISFTSTPTPIEVNGDLATSTITAATTTDVSTTTSTTTTEADAADVSTTTTFTPPASGTEQSSENISSTSETVVSKDVQISSSTASTTEYVSTTTDTQIATTTDSIIDVVSDIIEEIINTVTDTIQNAVDTITNNSDEIPVTENPPVVESLPTVENPTEDIVE